MKKLFQLMAAALLVIVVASCSQGAKAVNEAYEEACKAEPSEKIATTLCNGEIKCETLSVDELAKLGAVLDYLANHGMYSANFEAQVDMYQFGRLLDSYRSVEKNVERVQLNNYVREINIAQPLPPAPPAGPAPEGLAPEAPAEAPVE